MCDEWINVDVATPLPEHKGKYVIGDYLVTVSLFDKDPQDDDEVVVAVWDCLDQTWGYFIDSRLKYDTLQSGWKVIAWKPLPAAYVKPVK